MIPKLLLQTWTKFIVYDFLLLLSMQLFLRVIDSITGWNAFILLFPVVLIYLFLQRLELFIWQALPILGQSWGCLARHLVLQLLGVYAGASVAAYRSVSSLYLLPSVKFRCFSGWKILLHFNFRTNFLILLLWQCTMEVSPPCLCIIYRRSFFGRWLTSAASIVVFRCALVQFLVLVAPLLLLPKKLRLDGELGLLDEHQLKVYSFFSFIINCVWCCTHLLPKLK